MCQCTEIERRQQSLIILNQLKARRKWQKSIQQQQATGLLFQERKTTPK